MKKILYLLLFLSTSVFSQYSLNTIQYEWTKNQKFDKAVYALDTLTGKFYKIKSSIGRPIFGVHEVGFYQSGDSLYYKTNGSWYYIKGVTLDTIKIFHLRDTTGGSGNGLVVTPHYLNTHSSSITSGNGVTISGGTANLGGILSGEVDIDGNQLFIIGGTTPLSTFNLHSDAINLVGSQVNVDADSIYINLGSSGGIVQDNRSSSTKKGLQYNADYSANFIARSLIDKGYADSHYGGGGSGIPYTGAYKAIDFNAKSVKNFYISKTTDTTAKFLFEPANISTNTIRTINIPNRSFKLDSINPNTTVSGTGFLKGNGANISFDNSTYLTANQSISLGGILSGSGTTSITASAGSGYYMPTTTDQSNWNGKQATLTNPVTGGNNGVLGNLTFTNGYNTIQNSSQLWYDTLQHKLSINAGHTKLSQFTVKANADVSGLTGTTTINNSTSMVGVGTKFTTELGLGDRISVSSASSTYATVLTITDDTHLTLSSALGNNTAGTTINKKSAILRVDDASGNTQKIVNDQGFCGYGILNPISHLEVSETGSAATRGLYLSQYSTDAAGVLFQAKKARGTQTSPTTIANGDFIGSYIFNAYDGTNNLSTCIFGAKANGTVTSGSVPTDMYFQVGSSNQTLGNFPNLYLRPGNLNGILTATPQFALDIQGSIRVTTTNKFYLGGTISSASDYYHSLGSSTTTLTIKPRVDDVAAVVINNAAANAPVFTANTTNQSLEVGLWLKRSVGANVASAATITPTGGIFHVTGTTQITTINIPYTGWTGELVIIPDGLFTTATGGNIALGTTVVVGRVLKMIYDGISWYPSY